MSNPSTRTLPEPWHTRPSIQDRVTLFSDNPRKVICTIVHVGRVDDADLKLICATPQMAAALQLARRALFAVAGNKPGASDLLSDAALEVTKAIASAGLLDSQRNAGSPDEDALFV